MMLMDNLKLCTSFFPISLWALAYLFWLWNGSSRLTAGWQDQACQNALKARSMKHSDTVQKESRLFAALAWDIWVTGRKAGQRKIHICSQHY